jgi:hypothetical protein
VSAPNEWRRGKHAKSGRYHIPDPHTRVLLFLLVAAVLLAAAAVPVGHELGTHLMKEALAR